LQDVLSTAFHGKSLRDSVVRGFTLVPWVIAWASQMHLGSERLVHFHSSLSGMALPLPSIRILSNAFCSHSLSWNEQDCVEQEANSFRLASMKWLLETGPAILFLVY
jgi:hypothetical protein